MKLLLRAALSLLLLGSLGGCAYFKTPFGIDKPSISLVGLQLKRANLLEQTFVTQLRADNPNDFDLPVRSIELELLLENQSLGRGNTPHGFVIPANSDKVFALEIHTNLFSNLKLVKELVDSKPKEITYQIHGELSVNLPLFWVWRDISLDKTETISTATFKRKK